MVDTGVPQRLACFDIEGLFGEVNYHIPLKTDLRITAIIAPNGKGKTLCLRLINALFTRRWTVFSEVPFDYLLYTFLSGTSISVTQEKLRESREESDSLNVLFKITLPGTGEPIVWSPKAIDQKAVQVPFDRYIPYITRRGPTQYYHDFTGIVYSAPEILENFGEQLPSSVRAGIYGQEPEELSRIVEGTDCHLIETQRLLILQDDADVRARSGRPRSTLAISKKAETLKSIIGSQLTAYATLSQSLDRSFPRRVIAEQQWRNQDDLLVQLNGLDERRQKLTAAGILEKEPDEAVNLPQGPMDPAIARVLSVYARDIDVKLNSLSALLSRIELFLELITQRFSSKTVSVNRKSGIEVAGNRGVIPLEKLSSGEQHQLVLLFELLFELRENALILIDEPELSLHVTWQKKFISDLIRIIELNKFDVLLATHSPQLVSRWNSMVVDLGPVDEE